MVFWVGVAMYAGLKFHIYKCACSMYVYVHILYVHNGKLEPARDGQSRGSELRRHYVVLVEPEYQCSCRLTAEVVLNGEYQLQLLGLE